MPNSPVRPVPSESNERLGQPQAPDAASHSRARSLLGPILYGFLFVVLVPLALVAWASATEQVVPLPAVQWFWPGLLLAVSGLALIGGGMLALWRHGGGLPMNAFPPPRFVDHGLYGLLGHPIYVGFALVCLGASLAAGSASGLWLVTPLTVLGMAALVFGHERPDLQRRFGANLRKARLALPAPGEAAPTPWERCSVYVLVLLPWAVLYEAVQRLGVPPDAIDSHLPWELSWPVLEWTEALYASAYVFVLAVPMVVQSRGALRRFSIAGLLATAVVTLVYLTVPLVAPPRPFTPTTWLGEVLAREAAFNNTVAAFPSFHALWMLLGAYVWPRRSRAFAWVWAAVVSTTCVTTGMHSVLDIVAALAVFPIFAAYDRVWSALRRATEAVANSWQEWRFGPVRVINHGVYIALGGFIGLTVVAMALGPSALPGLLIVCLAALAGAGLWAQWLEGSSVLLRPFGFYGGLIGGLAGIAIAWFVGQDPLALLAGFAVGLPWAQAVGRLRCLVQGCCHGRPSSPEAGIRYRHTRSRVTAIAGLAGAPLHPTPLYSILANAVVGVTVLRLWTLGASLGLVAGLYLILSGLGRFVEESYRGEPQTPAVAGLHVYHWLAVASVVGGAVLTTLQVPAPEVRFHAPGALAMLSILAASLLAGFLMGVDFPASNRRFSRLGKADGPVGLLPEDAPPNAPGTPADFGPQRPALD